MKEGERKERNDRERKGGMESERERGRHGMKDGRKEKRNERGRERETK